MRLNVWLAPDLRAGEKARPHSHPWPFEAKVLCGGYREDRYQPTPSGVLREEQVEHLAGGTNRVPLDVFHEVTHIEDPGGTVSLMLCGPTTEAGWGYIDPHSGDYRRSVPEPGFDRMLRDLNPHQKW